MGKVALIFQEKIIKLSFTNIHKANDFVRKNDTLDTVQNEHKHQIFYSLWLIGTTDCRIRYVTSLLQYAIASLTTNKQHYYDTRYDVKIILEKVWDSKRLLKLAMINKF